MNIQKDGQKIKRFVSGTLFCLEQNHHNENFNNCFYLRKYEKEKERKNTRASQVGHP